MHYLLEGALSKVTSDIIDVEEALLAIERIGYLENGVSIRVLSEKLSDLNTEKSKLEKDLN